MEKTESSRDKLMNKEVEIHVLENNVKIWRETSIPMFKASIEYFAKELAHGEIEAARLECEIASRKKELDKLKNKL